MKEKTILKIVVDIGMTVMLLFLMAYELIGEAAHEWLGIGMLVLFIIHHILNGKWSRSVFKGKYTLFRIWQTVLVTGILFTMAGSVYSGVILSKRRTAWRGFIFYDGRASAIKHRETDSLPCCLFPERPAQTIISESFGTRIKHHMGDVSIKMYDKFGHVLRIESTCNNIGTFRVKRKVGVQWISSFLAILRASGAGNALYGEERAWVSPVPCPSSSSIKTNN